MEKEQEKKKNKQLILIIALLLSIIIISVGVSIAVFTYFGSGNTNNVIQTGRVVFSYSDANGGGNGINITDALPMQDSVGKQLAGSSQYFDFSVTASTTSTDLSYEIVVKKDDNSTLGDDWVKIYLTEVLGNSEIETPITGTAVVPTYLELSTTTNSLLNGKTIYYGTVQAGEVAYGKNFRLRMWIKDPNIPNFDTDVLNNKNYKVRVNVAAISSN